MGPVALRDVRIFGAGLSGLVAAITLARAGHRVTVFDREPDWGGDRRHHPSTHTTSILPAKVSGYVGIDLTPAFHPLLELSLFLHDTRLAFPVSGLYSTERGTRPTSLDSLLHRLAREAGVRLEFGAPLSAGALARYPGSIIACGLSPSAYELLDIPHRRFHGWASRGPCARPGRSWIWLGDGVTEYGYSSSLHGGYSDLLFSTAPIPARTLERYRAAEERHLGVVHEGWRELTGVVPLASARNPRLVRGGHICCGTVAGFMDPLGWFGINGALVSGRIAAQAVTDLPAAEREFARFSRAFRRALHLKDRVWTPLLRPRLAEVAWVIERLGKPRVEAWLARHVREDRHLPIFAIPGFGHLATRY